MTKYKDESEKKKRGRKSLFKEEYIEQALKLCLLGATDKDMADFFGVSTQTLNAWKKNQDFLDALKKGKEIADANVASRLYNRAIGYSCPATKFAMFEGKITDREQYIEHYPPDTTAAIFWLKNRRPDLWRDRKDQNVNVSVNDDLENMTDDELVKIIRDEGQAGNTTKKGKGDTYTS